jgi:hypothetical protein
VAQDRPDVLELVEDGADDGVQVAQVGPGASGSGELLL